jgi:hypothetical protein
MQRRRRFKQTLSLKERLSLEAKRLRDEARRLSAGPEQADLLRKAREDEVTAKMVGWIASPGLQPPK